MRKIGVGRFSVEMKWRDSLSSNSAVLAVSKLGTKSSRYFHSFKFYDDGIDNNYLYLYGT